MDLSEIKSLLDAQGRTWEEYKKTVDKANAEHKTDLGEVREKFAKMDKDFDRFGKALTEVEKLQQRMELDVTSKKDGLSLEQREHKGAFQKYMRKGVESNLKDLEAKTMSVGSDPDGGYFVPEDTSGRMISKIFETSPMRGNASEQTISTDALEGPNDLQEGVSGGWVGEQTARTTTGTPQVGKWRIPVHEQYAFPKATQTLLDDAAINVESWLTGKTTEKMAREETTAFFTGVGSVKPRGILTYTTVATVDASRAWGQFEHIVTGANGAFGADPAGAHVLIDLVHRGKAAYRAASKWWMSRLTLAAVRKLKDANGQFIWLPSMQAVQASSLLGYPVVEAEDMPAFTTTGALAIGFGDMRTTYQIVDRQGIRVLRDALTDKPYVGFYVTRRVGGDVLHFESFKFLKFST
jgi:HK97 family phage major capsid protein